MDEWEPKLRKWSWWRDDLPNLLEIAWYFAALVFLNYLFR